MSDAPSPRVRWALRLLPLVVIAIGYGAIVRFGLVADARLLIRENAFLRRWDQLVPNLSHDYFWSSSGASIPYWRPLTKASWLVEWRLGSGGAWLFFVVQLVWLAVAALGVAGLVRRLDGSAVAGAVAALLFALHPAVIEPAALVMARSDLVAAAALVWSLCGFLDWQRGVRGGFALHVTALLIALGSKESSVVAPPLVALLWLATAPTVQRRDVTRLVFATASIALYLGLRAMVLRGVAPAGIVFDALRLGVAGARYMRNLAPWSLASSIRNIPIAEAQSSGELVWAALTWAALGLVAAMLLLRLVRRGERKPAWLLVATLLPLLPVLLVKKVYVPSIEGKLALADRWLLGSLLFSSTAVALAGDALRRAWPRATWPLLTLLTVWVGARLVLLPAQLAPYASEETLLDKEDETYRATPDPYRTVEDRCRAADRAMLRAAAADRVDEAESAYRAQPEPCAQRVDATFNLLALQVRNRRFTAARPLVDALLSRTAELDERNQAPFAYLAGEVFVETGEPARGQQLLEQAIQRGVRTCAVLAALGRAFELQGNDANASLAKARAQQCYNRPR